MQRVIIKELVIFTVLFFTLALAMHPDLLGDFSSRYTLMDERGNFFHPFIYTTIVYIILFIFRFITKRIISLVVKIKNK